MHRSLFYKAFPPPIFLKMPAFGLDISDGSVHFVELKDSKDGLVVSNFGEKKIPSGIVESGEIKDANKLTEILSSIKDKVGTSFVNLSLPEQHAYLFKLRIANMKRNEVRSNVELQLEENVPISAREAVFDYDILKDMEDGQTDIELSVLPKSVVENYLSVLKNSGFTPASFEIEAQAIARSVVPDGDKGTFMVVDFGKTRSGISIVSNGITRFTSTVEIGGSSLTKVIEKTLKIKTKEAEEIKKEKGIVPREENEELFLTMMSIVGVLKDEINKHYIYWLTHKDHYGKKRPKVEKIILCGGDANLSGLTEYLSTGIDTHVELANVMINVNSFDKYIPDIKFSESLQYSTAIGLALRQP
jgi:type IV pilus assembly protein PilM